MKLIDRFVLVAGVFFLTACSVSPDDIRIGEVGGVDVRGVTFSQARLIVQMTLVNDSGTRLTIQDADLAVSDDRGTIAWLSMDDELVLKRKSATEVALPLTVRFDGAFGSVTALPRLKAAPEHLLVSGTVRLKGGLLRKKLSIDRVPLKDFLDMLGTSKGELF